MARASLNDRTYDLIVKSFLLLWGLLTIYPIFYVFISSISEGSAVDSGAVMFFPINPNLESYKNVLDKPQFWISYANTFFYTIFGTLYSMMISMTAAFALSRRYFRPRKMVNIGLSFTLWFSAGFIPLYMNYKDLGVINDRWGIVVSFGVQAFYIILLRNYFENIPTELDEAAKIDGATEFRVFTDIYLPLSKPAMTTIAIYYAISRWNGFFWAMVLLKQTELIPLQVYLQQMVINEQLVLENANTVSGQLYSFSTLKYALVACSIIPIILIYPFIQRYFTKGIMLGGVKE